MALDSMAMAALSPSPRGHERGIEHGTRNIEQSTRGIIDSSALLTGLEEYAPDGRHYKGRGAITMINAVLNEMMRAKASGGLRPKDPMV